MTLILNFRFVIHSLCFHSTVSSAKKFLLRCFGQTVDQVFLLFLYNVFYVVSLPKNSSFRIKVLISSLDILISL